MTGSSVFLAAFSWESLEADCKVQFPFHLSKQIKEKWISWLPEKIFVSVKNNWDQAGILEWVAMPFSIYIWQCMCIHATLSIRLTRYLPPLQCSAPSGKPMKQLRVGVYVWGWLRAGAYVRGWFSSVGEHGDSASFQLCLQLALGPSGTVFPWGKSREHREAHSPS